MSKKTILNRHARCLEAAKAVQDAAASGASYPSAKVNLALIEDLSAFATEWSAYLTVRRSDVGEVAVGMDAAVQLLSHATVSDQVAHSDAYDRGDYFGPFRMQGEAFLAGDPLLLATNGDVHARWRGFIAKSTPGVDQLGARMGEVAIDVLAAPQQAGKLDTSEPLQRVVLDALHRLFLRLVLPPLELRAGVAYGNALFLTALPKGLQVVPLGPAVLAHAAYKNRVVKRYTKTPGFGRVQMVANSLGITAADAAGNLMLALHLASMPATAALVASVLGELCRRPALLAQVRAEYDAIRSGAAPSAPLTQAQVAAATLTESVIHETGRLHPPVQWTNSVLRTAKTYSIGGEQVTFAKGTRVMASLTMANLDPGVFPNPLAWDLGRDFSKAQTWNGMQGPQNTRDCVGRPIAMSLVQTLVLTIVGRYLWDDVDPATIEWPTERLATVRPDDLVLRGFAPRPGV